MSKTRKTTRPAEHKPGRPSATRIERRRAAVERRRAFARASVAAQVRARRRHQLVLRGAVAGTVVVVLAVVGVIVWRRGGDDNGPSAALNGEQVDTDGQALGIIEPRPAYSITYRVETFSGETATVSTETTHVRRPFDSRVTSATGEPPGGTQEWAVTSALGRYARASGIAAATATAIAPTTAIGDLRLDASLDDLVTDGSFVQRERRQLLGRECQVYRTGLPPENLDVAVPTETDYTDVCIDAAGLMLEEVYVAAGQVLMHRTAVEVDDLYQPADTDFAIDAEPTGADAGGADVEPIDAAVAPVAGYWSFASPPEGYTLEGRYVVRQPDDSPAAADPSVTTTAPAAPAYVESYADVYVNGTDTIVVLQGPLAAQPQGDVTAAEAVESPTLGSTQTVAGINGPTILAHPAAPADWYVQITGTTSLAELTDIAATLAAAA